MIIVDTSVWIDYFNGVTAPHTKLLDKELQNDRIIIGDLIIAELLQGFKTTSAYNTALELIGYLEFRDMCSKKIAVQAAANYRILRKKGITVRKTVYMLIATFCIENNCLLLHNDRDFNPIENHLGLQVCR